MAASSSEGSQVSSVYQQNTDDSKCSQDSFEEKLSRSPSISSIKSDHWPELLVSRPSSQRKKRTGDSEFDLIYQLIKCIC